MIRYVIVVSERVRPKYVLIGELIECLAITFWDIERSNASQTMIESA